MWLHGICLTPAKFYNFLAEKNLLAQLNKATLTGLIFENPVLSFIKSNPSRPRNYSVSHLLIQEINYKSTLTRHCNTSGTFTLREQREETYFLKLIPKLTNNYLREITFRY